MKGLAAAASLVAVWLGFGTASADEPPLFVKPVGCAIGATCFIQQYADWDEGPGARDYRCGGAVYDGHDGTDFRLPDKSVEAAGVAVLAAAAGTVLRVRDGEADFAAGTFDPQDVPPDRECGNGLVIDHGGGWETQYCHLRRGSVRVAAGDVVEAGAPLGLVGQSGQAAFSHLHLTVRREGQAVDPFAFDASSCGAGGRSLWTAEAAAEMGYVTPQIINAGFAGGPVSMDAVEGGEIPDPTAASAALVFQARAINLEAGDVQVLTLQGPDGAVLAESTLPALDRNKAQYHAFVGKKLTAASWPAGDYTGRYAVMRGGKTASERTMVISLR